jgi:hypothetical protein
MQYMPLVVDDDIFLETLISCVKNEVGSFQHFYNSSKAQYKKSLVGDLKLLKEVADPDFERIHLLERDLNNCLNDELLTELEKSNLYEYIHDEKMTPVFLKLAKCSASEAKISDICKIDNSVFLNPDERNEYIVSYFSNIYKVPPGFQNNFEGCIENFLGREICENPIVLHSKLSANESANLEGDLSLRELDESVSSSKTRSAPGIDGINNFFIKTFWQFFRIPTWRYARKVFEKGQLSPLFSCGSIRLIPKKGDTSQIKNWRPISLLNCFYKIISRAINNRLKKAADRVLSRAQKGFTSSRYIQEVLINVIESIAYCNANNVAGSIVAIDVAKAFDSLNHNFMRETWKFFNFGPNLTNMLNTILNARTSCVILEDNCLSRKFQVETGAMQGDGPSPLIFNFNQQILLFRLELDPALASIFINHLIPRPIFNLALPAERGVLGPAPGPDPAHLPAAPAPEPYQVPAMAGPGLDDPAPVGHALPVPVVPARLGPDPAGPDPPVPAGPDPVRPAVLDPDPMLPPLVQGFPHIFNGNELFNRESNRETCKTDVFADDTTAMLLTTIANITVLRHILTLFGNISGLRCNIDKTSIMPVGNKNAFTAEMVNVGFPVTNSIHLLGLDINDDLSSLSIAHAKTIEKIRKTISFWHRLRLSLPGRLNIAKTLLLGQINYLGCILTPTVQQYRELKNLIYTFIQGSTNISLQRVVDSPDRGGLGMIDIESFVKSQQVNWAKRAQLCTKDNWRYDLKRSCNGTIWSLSKTNIDVTNNPILYNIACSFEALRWAYDSVNDNFRESFLLNNPSITRERRDNRLLNMQFFRQVPPLDTSVVAKFKFKDFFGDLGMKSLAEINASLNIPLNLATYMRIGTALTNYFQRLNRNRITDGTSIGLDFYLCRFKKGSKPIRKIFADSTKIKQKKICEIPHIKSFYRLIGLQTLDDTVIKKQQNAWIHCFYPNKLRDFILKFNSNILGLNTRVSHFVADRSRKCTFCESANRAGERDETFLHLFFECPSTINWLNRFQTDFFPGIVLPDNETKKQFWFCHYLSDNQLDKNFFICTLLWVIKLSVWEAKLRKKNPSYVTLKQDTIFSMNGIYECSELIKSTKNNNNFLVCREWDRIRRGR